MTRAPERTAEWIMLENLYVQISQIALRGNREYRGKWLCLVISRPFLNGR